MAARRTVLLAAKSGCLEQSPSLSQESVAAIDPRPCVGFLAASAAASAEGVSLELLREIHSGTHALVPKKTVKPSVIPTLARPPRAGLSAPELSILEAVTPRAKVLPGPAACGVRKSRAQKPSWDVTSHGWATWNMAQTLPQSLLKRCICRRKAASK